MRSCYQHCWHSITGHGGGGGGEGGSMGGHRGSIFRQCLVLVADTCNCGCHVTDSIVQADLANPNPQGQMQQILHQRGLVHIFGSGSPAESRISGRCQQSPKSGRISF